MFLTVLMESRDAKLFSGFQKFRISIGDYFLILETLNLASKFKNIEMTQKSF